MKRICSTKNLFPAEKAVVCENNAESSKNIKLFFWLAYNIAFGITSRKPYDGQERCFRSSGRAEGAIGCDTAEKLSGKSILTRWASGEPYVGLPKG